MASNGKIFFVITCTHVNVLCIVPVSFLDGTTLCISSYLISSQWAVPVFFNTLCHCSRIHE